jgi:hypothetical protein
MAIAARQSGIDPSLAILAICVYSVPNCAHWLDRNCVLVTKPMSVTVPSFVTSETTSAKQRPPLTDVQRQIDRDPENIGTLRRRFPKEYGACTRF